MILTLYAVMDSSFWFDTIDFLYLICCLLNFRGNVIDMYAVFTHKATTSTCPPHFFYKSTHIALDENHKGIVQV